MNQQSPFHIQTSINCYDLAHGFLPEQDPILQLSNDFTHWEDVALSLPKLITNTKIRPILEALPAFKINALSSPQENERAMLILSYIAHAYVWCDQFNPATRLPANISQAWYQVSQKVERPPVLSYASYALYNWCRLNPDLPVELGNIVLLQNFLGGADEEWFILIHVDIEHKAIPLISALLPLIASMNTLDYQSAITQFDIVINAMQKICKTLERMPEHCDPYIYFNRVRPYIHGWKGSEVLATGLIYSGVEAYGEKPVQFKGETGAQSTIIPCLDAVLGIQHKQTKLSEHLEEMRSYMPKDHHHFLLHLQNNGNIRALIEQAPCDIIERYNRCVELVFHFRSIHLNYAKSYIEQQEKKSPANSNLYGTGGTPFIQYLEKHQRETQSHLIKIK